MGVAGCWVRWLSILTQWQSTYYWPVFISLDEVLKPANFLPASLILLDSCFVVILQPVDAVLQPLEFIVVLLHQLGQLSILHS